MDPESVLQQRLTERLISTERRVRLLTGALAVTMAAGLIAATAPQDQQQVIRTRGVVIVDEAGRERIVLGAPMSNATSDKKLASTIGFAVLDTAGKLHVAVGTNNPVMASAQEVRNRISLSTGINIYDLRTGVERGGMGTMADGRANICLDYSRKLKEAACLAVAPNDQYAAVILNGGPDEKDFDRATMWVDAQGGASLKAMGGLNNRSGVFIRAGGSRGPASILTYDSTGKALPDLLRQP